MEWKYLIGVFVVGLMLSMGLSYMVTPPKEKVVNLWMPENSDTVIVNEGSEITAEKFSIVKSGEEKFAQQGNKVYLLTNKEVIRVSENIFKGIIRNSSLKTSIVLVKKNGNEESFVKAFYITQMGGKVYISEKTMYLIRNGYLIKKVALQGGTLIIFMQRNIDAWFWAMGISLSLLWAVIAAVIEEEGVSAAGFSIAMIISATALALFFSCIMIY